MRAWLSQHVDTIKVQIIDAKAKILQAPDRANVEKQIGQIERVFVEAEKGRVLATVRKRKRKRKK